MAVHKSNELEAFQAASSSSSLNSSGSYSDTKARPNRLLIKQFCASALDQIMLYLAFSALRSSGHRHGAFLDAAATAAKCAIYTTYIEEGQNLRLTGQLHHIEPKRVKVMVEEVRQALTKGKVLKTLGSNEPRYLIQLPFVWLEQYAWQPGQPRIAGKRLLQAEKRQVEALLPEKLPDACLIDALAFMDMIEFLHLRSQEGLPIEQRSPLSEAMAEHIKRRLIHSKTVTRIDTPWGEPFYALTRVSYTPAADDERASVVVEDTARFYGHMCDWADGQPQVLRIVEELNISASRGEAALAELDQMVREWADRHHQEGGESIVLHMTVGPQ